MKTYNIILTGLVLIGLIGCSEELPINEDQADPIQVTLSQVEKNDGYETITASGQLQSIKGSNISTRMMGFIDGIEVHTGDIVAKGQLLVRISSADLSAKSAQVEAAIVQAETNFNTAERNYERFKKLHANGSASDKELEDVAMNYEMSEAGLSAAREMKKEVEAQWSYAKIKAPYAGRIEGVFAKEGDMASPGSPLLRIESQGGLEAKIMVSESQINQISQGMEVVVFIKSLQVETLGEVTEISYSSYASGGQYLVKVALPNNLENLRSGMFINARLKSTVVSDSNPILIPNEALVRKGQLVGVYTLGYEDKALLRWLRIGHTIGDEVEVISGLAEGESFITSAQGRLYNGAKVAY